MRKQTKTYTSLMGRLLPAALFCTFLTSPALAQSDLTGTYRIRVKADGRYLHEDGNGDKFLSTRYQANDDFTRFRLTRNANNSYKITTIATNRFWHEHAGGDKIVSTRYNFDDAWNQFNFEKQNDGSFVIRSVGSGRFLHEDGGGDKLLSSRYQPNPIDDFCRFFLEPVQPPAQPNVISFGEKGNKANSDFRSRTQPVGWTLYVNQTPERIYGSDLGGQVTDLRLYQQNPLRYAYASVKGNPYNHNTVWMGGYTSADLNKYLNDNALTPETLHGYDSGNGEIRFVATATKNGGWWNYQYGPNVPAMIEALNKNNARPVQFSSYRTKGALQYVVLMAPNPNKTAWWMYNNIPASEVVRLTRENKARLTDLDINDEGRYNVVMEGCNGDCPAFWFAYDMNSSEIVNKANELQARPFDVNVYPGCGSVCVAALLIDNSGYEKPAPAPGSSTALRAAHSGMCLSVSSRAPGAPIVQEPCTAEDAGQSWNEKYVASPWAMYINNETGLCMEPAGGPSQKGAFLVQWTCDPNRKEQWFHLRPVNDDTDQSVLVPRLTTNNQCADIEGAITAPGARLTLWDCNSASNQLFIRYANRAKATSESFDAERFVMQNVLGIEDPDPEICWKNTTTRTGHAATSCPSSHPESDGAFLCYNKCAAGYSATTITTCGQVCPAGWINEPGSCRKPGSYQVTGYALKLYNFWWSIDYMHQEAKARCEAGEKRACEWRGALYYPTCKATFAPETLAPYICSAVCQNGMTDTGFGSCFKKSYFREAVKTECAPGTQRDAHDPLGLCYAACPKNSTAVGPVCWGGCSGEYGQACGAACAKSIDACVYSIGNMITETGFMVLNITNLVLTAGGGTPAVKAAQTAARKAGKVALNAAERAAHKASAKKMLRDGAEQAKKQGLKDALDAIGNAKDANDALDKMADSLVSSLESGEFDYRELIPTMADFDPTGILSVVRAFNKPICK